MTRTPSRRQRGIVKVAVAAAAALSTAVAALAWTALTPTPSGAAPTVTLDADAYVDIGRGFDNFGGGRQLSVDIGKNSFLRFTVAGLSAPVRKATLRVHVTDNWLAGSDQGGALRAGCPPTAGSRT